MAQHNYRYLFFIVFVFFSLTVNAVDKLPIEMKQQLLMGNYHLVLPDLIQLAEQGNTQAQYQLAQFFLKGLSVEKSVTKAKYWLQIAAQKNAKASYLLGSLYWQGELLEKNLPQAVHYLTIASQQGSRKAEKLLISIKTVNKQSNSRLTKLFFRAVKQGRLEQLAKLLQKGILLDSLNEQGDSVLIVAIKSKQQKVALWLLEQARKKDKEVKVLLKFNHKDQWGNSALHLAVNNKLVKVTNLLIRYKANLNSLNVKKQTALILAVKTRQRALAQHLINEGANYNIKDNQGMTALDYAKKLNLTLAIQNKKTLATNPQQSTKKKILALQQQALDKNSPYFNWPLLAIAVAQKQQSLIDKLLIKGENPWYSGKKQFEHIKHSAIATALRIGDTKSVIRFLNLNTKQPINKEQLNNLFLLAIKYNNLAVIDSLLENFDFTSLDQVAIDKSPLWLAISLNNYDAFMHLCKIFSVKKTFSKQKTSYLLLATEKNFTPIAQQLIAMGVNVNFKNDKGRNALWYAADHGNKTLVTDLLHANSQVEQTDEQGYTPLMRAVLKNCYECADLLLRYGANAEKQTSSANTALMFAAQGKPKILALMLKSEINIKARNKYSLTPLMLAIKTDCEACVTLLLQAGANPKRKNEQGENSFDLAKDKPAILLLLKSSS